jgi:hypothetical protein
MTEVDSSFRVDDLYRPQMSRIKERSLTLCIKLDDPKSKHDVMLPSQKLT